MLHKTKKVPHRKGNKKIKRPTIEYLQTIYLIKDSYESILRNSTTQYQTLPQVKNKLIKNRAEKLNRHFFKENIKGQKSYKKYSISTITSEI